MPYTARVKTCEPKTENGAVQLCARVEVLRDGSPVHEFTAHVDHAHYPTEPEVRAELRRLADVEVQRLTDADATAASLQGASL